MTTDQLDHNKQLVEAFIQELFTKGDLSAVDRYLDPGFVNHDSPMPGAPAGREGMRFAASTCRHALPDWHSDVEQLIAEDDIVVEVFTASGTHRREFLGVPGTGKTLTLRGINVFRVANDRIVERWGQLDQMGLLHQLGLVPAP
jgi:steroid delta-isomerase-like uncharacterized protein